MPRAAVNAMTGKVALVMGGGGGIGRAVAFELAAAGAAVVVAGRTAEPCRKTVAAISEALPNARVSAAAADILDYAACRNLVAEVIDEAGRLDALVNCANVAVAGMGGRFEQLDPARFDGFLSASLTALFNIFHAALPAMRGRGGAMVAFASDSGKVAAPNQTMIGATRSAIMMFTRSLALEVAAQGVRVNCISSSFVKDTPVYDMVMGGPLASRARTAARRAGLGLPGADDLAGLARFLCSDAAAHLTGQVISVNGGVTAA
ncbi:MAG: hypothetical protein JWQ97_2562 [Phenylobacterium sp.]|nr:hypothetical protein [Phenylobacterium sp.]